MKRGEGTLYRQQNSRFWWYRIGFQGRIICASTKTTDARAAREVLKQKYRELEAAKGGFVTMPGPEAKRVTVGQLLDELLADYELHGRRSIKGVRSHVKRVREELGEIRAVDLKPKDLTGYQIARRKADAAGGTINRELALLRRAARRFLEEQRLSMPRVTPLPENVREGFFTQTEVAKLVKHLPEDLHDFVWFAFLTGWRKGEIALLKWADVDEEAKTLRLSWRKSKNSQARTMALAGELANIMKRCGRRPPNERHRPRDDDRFRRVLGVVQGQADQPGGLRRLHPQANWRRLLDNSSARGVRRQPGRDPRYEGRSSTDPCRVRARCRGRMGQQGACLSRVISKGEGDGDRRSNTGRIPLERTAPRAGKWVASARKCGARTWPTGSRTPSGASGARASER